MIKWTASAYHKNHLASCLEISMLSACWCGVWCHFWSWSCRLLMSRLEPVVLASDCLLSAAAAAGAVVISLATQQLIRRMCRRLIRPSSAPSDRSIESLITPFAGSAQSTNQRLPWWLIETIYEAMAFRTLFTRICTKANIDYRWREIYNRHLQGRQGLLNGCRITIFYAFIIVKLWNPTTVMQLIRHIKLYIFLRSQH